MGGECSAEKRDRDTHPGTQDEMSTRTLLMDLIEAKDEAAFEE